MAIVNKPLYGLPTGLLQVSRVYFKGIKQGYQGIPPLILDILDSLDSLETKSIKRIKGINRFKNIKRIKNLYYLPWLEVTTSNRSLF